MGIKGLGVTDVEPSKLALEVVVFEVENDQVALRNFVFFSSRGACRCRIDDVFERWFEEVEGKTRGGASKMNVGPSNLETLKPET